MNPMEVQMDLMACGSQLPPVPFTERDQWLNYLTSTLLRDLLEYGNDDLFGNRWFTDVDYLKKELSRKREVLFNILPDWPGLTNLPNHTLGKIYQTIMQVRSEYRKQRAKLDSDLCCAWLDSSDTTEAMRKLKVEYFHFLTHEELGSSPGERVSISDVDETTIPCPVEEYRPAPLPEDEFDEACLSDMSDEDFL